MPRLRAVELAHMQVAMVGRVAQERTPTLAAKEESREVDIRVHRSPPP